MSFFLDLYNLVVQFFDQVMLFLTSGIFDFFRNGGDWLLLSAQITLLDLKIWFIDFFWSSAKAVLVDLGYSDKLQASFSGIGSDIIGLVSALRLPESLNLVLAAYVSKFVMRFFGF